MPVADDFVAAFNLALERADRFLALFERAVVALEKAARHG
jgi:hypothetical protein